MRRLGILATLLALVRIAPPAHADKQPVARGHELATYEDIFTGTDEIGAATGIEFGPAGMLTAVAEPRRRGGGAARVVTPVP